MSWRALNTGSFTGRERDIYKNIVCLQPGQRFLEIKAVAFTMAPVWQETQVKVPLNRFGRMTVLSVDKRSLTALWKTSRFGPLPLRGQRAVCCGKGGTGALGEVKNFTENQKQLLYIYEN